jgi:hypothetical protein
MNAGRADLFLQIAPFSLVIISAAILASAWPWTVLSLCLGVTLFLLTQRLNARRERINRVFNTYSGLYLAETGRGAFFNGLEALLRAGVTTLRSENELRSVCLQVTARQWPHPNWDQEHLALRKMLRFLKFCERTKQIIKSVSDTDVAIALFNKELHE